MLSFQFKLTAAQTHMLLLIAFKRYDPSPEGLELPQWPRKMGVPDHFVPIVHNLQAKGLVTHSNDRYPVYQATPEGEALAKLILKDAVDIVKLHRGLKSREQRFASVTKSHKWDSPTQARAKVAATAPRKDGPHGG